MTVDSIPVAENRFAMWGVRVNDYKVDGVAVDFETLVVGLATGQALTIEQEVEPLANISRVRNAKLKRLGVALANLANAQANFKPDQEGGAWSGNIITEDTKNEVNNLYEGGSSLFEKDGSMYKITKANCERAIQLVKSEMDKLNNSAQADTTRLQSLVSSRDEKFSIASAIMSAVSEARTNVIRAMGA